MVRALEDLTEEEKLDAALAILALDFVGQLGRVESELDLDSKAVKQIKKKALDALERAFSSDNEDELSFEISIKDGLARIKKSGVPVDKGVGVRTRRSIPDLSEEQIEKIRVIFADLEDFNKKQPGLKKLKPTEGLLKAALDYFGLSAEVVINKLPKIMKDKLAATDEAFRKYYPEGYPKKPEISPFLSFLEKKYPKADNESIQLNRFQA